MLLNQGRTDSNWNQVVSHVSREASFFQGGRERVEKLPNAGLRHDSLTPNQLQLNTSVRADSAPRGHEDKLRIQRHRGLCSRVRFDAVQRGRG